MSSTIEKQPLIHTFFVISGSGLIPSEITEQLGLEPTRSRSDTKLVGKSMEGDELYRHPEWIIETDRVSGVSTDEELQKLLQVLWPRRYAIVSLLERYPFEAGFGTTIKSYGFDPLISVSPASIQMLKFFDVGYTIEVFNLSDG